jgi:hypothetical protein
MFDRLWKRRTPKDGARIVKIVKGEPLESPDGPAWRATAYGPARPCPMCRESGRRVREVQEGILRGTGRNRQFEPTGSDIQCDCGILWGDEARQQE